MTGSLASPLPEATSGSLHVVSKRRRPHRKSKTGCVDCRRRRVKCDERKPSCQSCVRRHVACIYTVQDQAGGPAVTVLTDDTLGHSPPTPDRASSRLSHETFRTASPQGQVTGPSPAETSLHLQDHSSPSDASFPLRTASTSTFAFGISDLALLHHWTLSTSLSICRESSCTDIWQRVLPEVGFEHPFVAHAVLSLAALHLAHSSGARDGPNVAKAAEHHNQALLGFRQAVTNITEANSEALFLWSLLNMIYVFGFLTQRCDGAVEDRASRVSRKELVLGIEWIPMIRGIEAVLYPTHNYLRFGRLQVIMGLGNWDDLEPAPEAASQGPDSYLCHTRETWKNSSEAETYDRVLRVLRKCWMFIRQFDTMDAATLATWGYNRSWSGPLMFIHFAPDAYFPLLHQRQPPALILFAYFGALLHGITDYWFMEGLGKEIVEVVGDLLGSYWRPWISWPLDVVGLD
ncbi:hypothetical protein B0I37DRAFT_219127 [Chaetomium sp. MPI-CAGE-AT-0009]|nr:hypothetical protein B0I37DRAFT_219127 [Chaetomium sp. MPI-CAGE-AT-0009]